MALQKCDYVFTCVLLIPTTSCILSIVDDSPTIIADT